MSTSKESKRRIQHPGNKKKKLSLIIIGSVILLGGVACGVALPLTLCSKTDEPIDEPVKITDLKAGENLTGKHLKFDKTKSWAME
jgi:flagellar basal body-associated protein FliL